MRVRSLVCLQVLGNRRMIADGPIAPFLREALVSHREFRPVNRSTAKENELQLGGSTAVVTDDLKHPEMVNVGKQRLRYYRRKFSRPPQTV